MALRASEWTAEEVEMVLTLKDGNRNWTEVAHAFNKRVDESRQRTTDAVKGKALRAMRNIQIGRENNQQQLQQPHQSHQSPVIQPTTSRASSTIKHQTPTYHHEWSSISDQGMPTAADQESLHVSSLETSPFFHQTISTADCDLLPSFNDRCKLGDFSAEFHVEGFAPEYLLDENGLPQPIIDEFGRVYGRYSLRTFPGKSEVTWPSLLVNGQACVVYGWQ